MSRGNDDEAALQEDEDEDDEAESPQDLIRTSSAALSISDLSSTATTQVLMAVVKVCFSELHYWCN